MQTCWWHGVEHEGRDTTLKAENRIWFNHVFQWNPTLDLLDTGQNILWLWIFEYNHFLYLLLKCLTLFLTFDNNSSHVGVTSLVRAVMHRVGSPASNQWSGSPAKMLSCLELISRGRNGMDKQAIWWEKSSTFLLLREDHLPYKILQDLFFTWQYCLQWRPSEPKMSFRAKMTYCDYNSSWKSLAPSRSNILLIQSNSNGKYRKKTASNIHYIIFHDMSTMSSIMLLTSLHHTGLSHIVTSCHCDISFLISWTTSRCFLGLARGLHELNCFQLFLVKFLDPLPNFSNSNPTLLRGNRNLFVWDWDKG